ncbi:HAD family hydrolase [Candidatus Woesearchaeota archaeon]|nr:HAD family hydrolase [Candidatus Woesearchaeota archaeon]
MPKKKLYGLIFDSDGTILDSVSSSFEWLKHCVVDLYKKPFPYENCSEQFLKDYNSSHRTKGLNGIYEIFGIDYDQEKDFLWENFNAWRADNPAKIIKGMDEAIFKIYDKSRPKPGKPRGLRMLLNTSNMWPSFEIQLRESGLIRCFDTIITRDNLPGVIDGDNLRPLVKPNTYSIEWALDLLGVDHEEALHVGDTLEDIEACRNLRRKDVNTEREVKVVAVTWGFETKENLANAKPYKIINNPKQLVKIVEQLGGFD